MIWGGNWTTVDTPNDCKERIFPFDASAISFCISFTEDLGLSMLYHIYVWLQMIWSETWIHQGNQSIMNERAFQRACFSCSRFFIKLTRIIDYRVITIAPRSRIVLFNLSRWIFLIGTAFMSFETELFCSADDEDFFLDPISVHRMKLITELWSCF